MMITLRRISQLLFLTLFVVLFFRAVFPYAGPLPADLFLRASPLVALAVMLAGRTFIATMILALVLLLLTIPFGRFFCGWICPLGTIIDGSDHLIRRKRRPGGQRESLRWRYWKFFILAGVLTAALFSIQFIWFFDPIALLTRTFTTVIYPVFAFSFAALFNAAFKLPVLEDTVYSLYDAAQSHALLPIQQPHFFQSALIVAVFAGILALGMVSRRFWCRNLCPLGALLGLFSKFRLTRRHVSEACTRCSLCQRACKMNAIEDDYTINNTVECIECAECVAACKPHAVSYTLGRNPGPNEVDLSRRRLMQASVAGLASLALFKTAAISRIKKGLAIRPPGALVEEQFLDRCIRCQECVKICSSTGACLQPSLTETGAEGIWSPVAIPREGYCEYSCNLCGQVCPTGAIQPLGLPEKQKTKIGMAYFDKTRCIPWYKQEDCLVCEEHCPLPEKAIRFDIHETRGPDGTLRVVKFPYVDEERCIGCGICENKCPVVGSPGIFVTAAKETRLSAPVSKRGAASGV
ncbi:MAG TPA: 4Fe-4S binding protein [bacterium]|nr:4Fe-4S binding protein [bacterium]HPR87380.1 4Fe-4S binding protein [bacterium]